MSLFVIKLKNVDLSFWWVYWSLPIKDDSIFSDNNLSNITITIDEVINGDSSSDIKEIYASKYDDKIYLRVDLVDNYIFPHHSNNIF